MRSLCFHNCIYKAPNLLGLLEYLRVRDPNYELNNYILESFLKKGTLEIIKATNHKDASNIFEFKPS